MQSVTSLIINGLWHKAGDKAVACRNRSDGALHSDHLIREEHDIITVCHIDFELAGGRFFDNTLVGEVLSIKCLSQCFE